MRITEGFIGSYVFQGDYAAPAGSYEGYTGPGPYSEAEFLEWYPIQCSFDLPTTSPPPALPLPGLVLVSVLSVLLLTGLAVRQRRLRENR